MSGIVDPVTIYEAATAAATGIGFLRRWRRRPRLIIERVMVANVLPVQRDQRVGRFVIATVRNRGHSAVEGCQGYLRAEDTRLSEYKLHWADTPYTPNRDTSEPVDIMPGLTRDLDIAFSVAEGENSTSQELRSVLGTQVFRESGSLPRGATVPPLSSAGERVSAGARTTYDTITVQSVTPLRGAWIALPIALAFPSIESQAYLAPGSYSTVAGVVDREGHSNEVRITITAGERWSDLTASV